MELDNIITLYKEFKSETEKREFLEAQHKTITELMNKNAELEEEVRHLKKLLVDGAETIFKESPVERVILTPEEALIETQIQIIQDRSYDKELSLEDIKKIDLLLKNKILLKKKDPKTLEAESKSLTLSNTQLLEIIKSNGPT